MKKKHEQPLHEQKILMEKGIKYASHLALQNVRDLGMILK
jgi:hypothetical protein